MSNVCFPKQGTVMGLTYKTEQPGQIVFTVLYEISHTPYISCLFVCLKRNLLERDRFKEAKTAHVVNMELKESEKFNVSMTES